MRFEKKYKTPYNIRSELRNIFLIKNTKESFPTRRICSIYYEMNDYRSFLDSEDGDMNRTKIRVRFYNKKYREGKIEFKIKESELGFKKYQNIDDSIRENGYKLISFKKDEFIKIPKRINNYFPILIVEYTRDYYETKDKSIRFTYDYDITYRSVLRMRKFLLGENVLEVKYNKDTFYNSDDWNEIKEEFDLNLSRFSKFCKGIEICL